MKYRTLGRTGLKVSEVSLGTWAFSSTVYGAQQEEVSFQAIQAALDNGINLFDTAPLYGPPEEDGKAETILGKGLGIKRKGIIISSKFGRKPSDKRGACFGGAYAIESVEESLKRLGTDYIDVLFFHSPFSREEINDDIWEGLNKLKESGKVRFIGHSISMFKDTEDMCRDWIKDRKIDVIQVVYSLMNRESTQLIKEAGEENVGILARESLANGFLTGTFTVDQVFPKKTINARYSPEEVLERVTYTNKLNFLAKNRDGMAQAALRWVLDNKNISSVLSGSISPDEIINSAAASDQESFSEEDILKAQELHTKDFEAA